MFVGQELMFKKRENNIKLMKGDNIYVKRKTYIKLDGSDTFLSQVFSLWII